MTNEAPDSPTLETLLAQAGWVRGLAHRLVADGAAAEDVEQGTWLAALQTPPRAVDDERSLRGWFARVARNVARQQARSDGARVQRERRTARAEPLPDAASVVDQATTHRRLVDAVLRLREPYRTTVLLRYFQDLSTEEIARRAGVPGSTVRDRLQRGIRELRAELRRELGDATWMSAIATLTGPAPLPPGSAGAADLVRTNTPPILGALAMGNTVKIVGAAALAAALGMLVWLRVQDRGSAPETGRAASVEVGRRGADADEADALQSAGLGAEEAARAALAANATPALSGLVTSLDGGEPLAGVTIATKGDAGPAQDAGRTDEEGRFTLDEAPDLSTSLAFTKAGYDQLLLFPDGIPRGEAAHVEVVLAPLGVLAVEVVDLQAAPIAGVPVLVASTESRTRRNLPYLFRTAVTDARGRAELAELPTGLGLTVSIRGRRDVSVASIDPATRRGSARLVLRPPGRVIGLALGADGSPRSGVRALLTRDGRDEAQASEKSDADGRFAFDAVEPGRFVVRAEAGESALEGELAPGAELDIGVLRVPDLVTVAGRLVSDFRFEAESFGIDAFRDGRQIGETLFPDRNGDFSLRVAPGELWLRVAEHATALMGDGAVWQRRSLHEIGEVARRRVRAPVVGLELRIDGGVGAVRGGIRALAGRDGSVDLHFHRGDVAPQDFARHAWILEHQELGVAVEDGRFESQALRAGRYHVAVDVAGAGRAWIRAVDVAPGVATDLGWLEPGVGALDGIVRSDGGEPLAAATVSLAAPWSAESPRAVADGDGRFRFEGLAPGAYLARATLPGTGKSPERAVDVPQGGTRTIELVVSPAARIAGRVLRGGAPAAGEPLTLGEPRNGMTVLTGSASTDAAGRFAFDDLAAGAYALYAGSDGHRGELIALAAGAALELEIELAAGTIELLPLLGNAPLDALSVARLVELRPSSGGSRRVATGELLADGWVRFPALEGQGLLLLTRAGVPGTLPALVEPLKAGGRAGIALSDHRLRVDADLETLQGPAPRLYLRSLAGFELEALPFRIELPREDAAHGAWIFGGVPASARLSLEGAARTGWDASRELASTDEPLQVVPWP